MPTKVQALIIENGEQLEVSEKEATPPSESHT